jgi:post-segregation antitoxin (ccd killing protein)
MKQRITISLDRLLLQRVRTIASKRGINISALLTEELRKSVSRQEAYSQAKARALAYLEAPFRLGGTRIRDREVLHERDFNG